MEPAKKNRSLLRSCTVKKRGNPIFVRSQPIYEHESTPIVVNKILVTPEQSLLIENLTALDNGSAALTETSTHRRQRTNEDNKHDEYHESFIVRLPSIAHEKRLDFVSKCDDSKFRPSTIAVTGELHPKEISLSIANSLSEGNNGRQSGMSIFKAFDAAFNNKWEFGVVSQETSSEIEGSSIVMKQHEDDKDPDGEELNEKRLRAEEPNDTTIGNGDDEKRSREKRACKSVFDLIRLMELRRVGLVKPPENPAKHIKLIEEIRKCAGNVRNKTYSNDDTVVLNENSCTTRNCNNEISLVSPVSSSDCSYTAVDINVVNMANIAPSAQDDHPYGQPILRRRRKQPNPWQNIRKRPRDDEERTSFKDRLNPIAAAEYDQMEVIELDMYDELPNQFRSDMPKEFTRHWSSQDTEEFYKCVALLGLDLGRIATVMGRTQKQITNKYKTEQKKNDKRLHNALVRQGEFFEYRKKYRF